MKIVGEKKCFSEYETCVLCGKSVGVLQSTSVQCRTDYIEGCGQLCPECARNVSESGKKQVKKEGIR